MTQLLQILGIPFLVCLEMIAILGYLGIHVLKREVIFIDIAMAQIAAVGALGAELAFQAHGHSLLGYVCAFGATLVAAAFYSLIRRGVVQIPLEAVIGVSYAIAAAGALFLLGIAPGGDVHVQQMLAGSILWATWTDVIWAAALFALVGIPLGIRRSRGARSWGVLLCVAMTFLYYLLLEGSEMLALGGLLPAALAIWSTLVLTVVSKLIQSASLLI